MNETFRWYMLTKPNKVLVGAARLPKRVVHKLQRDGWKVVPTSPPS